MSFVAGRPRSGFPAFSARQPDWPELCRRPFERESTQEGLRLAVHDMNQCACAAAWLPRLLFPLLVSGRTGSKHSRHPVLRHISLLADRLGVYRPRELYRVRTDVPNNLRKPINCCPTQVVDLTTPRAPK